MKNNNNQIIGTPLNNEEPIPKVIPENANTDINQNPLEAPQKQKKGNANEDFDELNNLDKVLDNLYYNLEESKKQIAKLKKEIIEQTDKKKSLLDYIKLYSELISNNNELIYILDNQITLIKPELTNKANYFYKENVFEGENQLYNILQNTKSLNKHQDTSSYLWLKNYELENDIQILSSEKFKFLKFCSSFYQGINSAVHVNSIQFSEFQFKIDEIVNGKPEDISFEDINPEKNLFNKISIRIFFKNYISLDEIRLKQLNLNRNEISYEKDYIPQYKLACIEYDHSYEITKKYNILELMTIACKYFSIDPMKYFIVDEHFSIWPYDLVIYQELLNLNIATYGVKPHCRFFQFHENLNEKFTFVIIHKMQMMELLKLNWDNFKFVNYCTETKNSSVVKHMLSKLQDIRDDPMIYREVARIKEENLNENVKKIMSVELLKLFKEIEKKTKNKKKKKQNIQLLDELNERDKLKEEIKEKYANILDKLNMDLDGLMKYYNQLVKNPKETKKNLTQLIKNQNNPKKSDKRGLDYFVRQIIEHKDTNIIPQKYLRGDASIPVADEYFYLKLLNYYIHMQKLEIEEIQKMEKQEDNANDVKTNNLNADINNSKDNKDLLHQYKIEGNDTIKKNNNKSTTFNDLSSNISFLNDDNPSLSLINDEKKKFIPPNKRNVKQSFINFLESNKFSLKLLEIIFIIGMIICNIYSLGKVSNTTISEFREDIKNTFNSKKNCYKEWEEARSYSSVNSWLLNCLSNTIQTTLYSSVNIKNKKYFSLGFDVKIQNKKTIICTNSDTYNISFSSNPICTQKKEISFFFEKKHKLLNFVGINYISNYIGQKNKWYNTLFITDKNLYNATIFSIYNQKDLNKFKNLLTVKLKFNCIYKNDVASCESMYGDNTNLMEYDKKYLKSYFLLTEEDNNIDLIDLSTETAYFEAYFMNYCLDLLSIVTFTYSSTNKGINTKISFKTLGIETGYFETEAGYSQYKHVFENLSNSSKTDFNDYDYNLSKYLICYFTFIINIVLYLLYICILLLTYINFRIAKSGTFLRNNIFIFAFTVEFFLESGYVLMNKLNGDTDYFYPDQLILSDLKYKGAIYIDENLKIFKAFGCILLIYQVITTCFTFNKIYFFAIFMKTIFQRVLFITILFHIALALLINLLIGAYYEEYHSFLYSLWRILTYSFGINHEQKTNHTYHSFYNRNIYEYLSGVLVLFRNIVINFSMIILVYYIYKEKNN